MKALIAMSGGVDSSVAAYLTKKQGYECIGATMRLYSNEQVNIEKSNTCCSLDDVEDARSVAFSMGMKYYVFNFTDDFEKQIIARFISAYENCFTPNPCIDCNRYMKFEKLYDRAKILECDKIVTGHYARVSQDENGRWQLKKAVDSTKDQSYVLYSLTQEQLSHTLFPLGEYEKTKVREIAEENGFVNAKKHDSQDICFVPDGDYAEFIKRYSGKEYTYGDFVDMQGNVLGEHKGIIKYTIGQRKGLGLALPAPMFVYKKDKEKNQVVLCFGDELFSSHLVANDFNWIYEKPTKPIEVKARIRYNSPEQSAIVSVNDDESVNVDFLEPQRAISEGQAVVLYDGENVVGGGTIISK